MIPQNVDKTVWALAKLDMPPACSLHRLLCAATERPGNSCNLSMQRRPPQHASQQPCV
jgi:hypothetical protein